MIALREKDFKKLTAILDIPEDILTKLHSMHLLNESVAIDVLVKYEFTRLKRKRKYKSKEIEKALAKEYGISESKVHNAIYFKKVVRYYCKSCGRPITQYRALNHANICEQCVIDSIEL